MLQRENFFFLISDLFGLLNWLVIENALLDYFVFEEFLKKPQIKQNIFLKNNKKYKFKKATWMTSECLDSMKNRLCLRTSFTLPMLTVHIWK